MYMSVCVRCMCVYECVCYVYVLGECVHVRVCVRCMCVCVLGVCECI